MAGKAMYTAHRAICSQCLSAEKWFAEDQLCFLCRQPVSMVMRHIQVHKSIHRPLSALQFRSTLFCEINPSTYGNPHGVPVMARTMTVPPLPRTSDRGEVRRTMYGTI